MISNIENKGLNFATDVDLPKYESLKTGLYNLRNINAGVKKTCFQNVHEVEIPNTMTDFTLADYSYNGNRIIIFCLPEMLCTLTKIKHVFCDGTFRSCPPPFHQILSIHGDVDSTMTNNNVIPLLYILMTNRTKKSYSLVFQ